MSNLNKAAAAMGRKGGAAGRGAAKARPLSSERARSIVERRWAEVAEQHKAADAACGREWVCGCGACRSARSR